MVSEKNTLLRTEHLSLSYGAHRAFCDVNLRIEKAKITSIVGPSGCGKSSLLTCLNRLIDYEPSALLEGHVYFKGKCLSRREPQIESFRRRVAMVFQNPTPFPLSIRKNFSIPLREAGLKKKEEIDHVIEKQLRGVGLWEEVKDRLHQSAISLSGGQQQRLCIARALCLEPEVLLMDEPCSSLDPLSSGLVEDLIVELGKKYAIVIVTHNLAQARRIADHVAFFWWKDGVGRLIEQGPGREFFSSPRHQITQSYIAGERG